MWLAFPTADYYGNSVPSQRHQVALTLPALSYQGVGVSGMVPTFTVFRWWGWCPALPLQPRRTHYAVPRPASAHS